MRQHGALEALLLVGALAGFASCAQESSTPMAPAGSSSSGGFSTAAGGSGTAGAAAIAGGAGAGGGGGGSPGLGADGLPAVCERDQVLPAGSNAKLKLQVHLKVAGQPLVFGEPNPLGANSSVLPANLRFYMSHPELVRSSGERISATFVSDAGAPKPYGVHFVNAEDSSTQNVELRAPEGDYTTVSFLLGLNDTCNGAFSPLEPPLDEASQLKWPHTFGFLFLRFEGLSSGSFDGLGFTPPAVIHMGGIPAKRFAPRVSFSGMWALSSADTTIAFEMDVLQMLRGATLDADLEGYEFPPPAPPVIGDEIIAGERLRQHVVDLPLFKLEQAPP